MAARGSGGAAGTISGLVGRAVAVMVEAAVRERRHRWHERCGGNERLLAVAACGRRWQRRYGWAQLSGCGGAGGVVAPAAPPQILHSRDGAANKCAVCENDATCDAATYIDNGDGTVRRRAASSCGNRKEAKASSPGRKRRRSARG